MHRLLVLCLLVGLAMPVAGQETTTTTLPAPPETTFQTTVKGTMPDIAGRWLIVAWYELPGGGKRTTLSFWDVARRDGEVAFRRRFVQVPAEQAEPLERQNHENADWTPTPEDLRAIAAGWDDLEPLSTRPAEHQAYLTGRDAFDDTFRADETVRDAQWVVQTTEIFDASAAPAVRQVSVFGILEGAGGRYRGKHVNTLLAVAPFPIPITLKGTFEMIRLDPAAGGFLARLGDLFSGCGR